MNISRINLIFMLSSPLIAILFGSFIAYQNELSMLPFSSNIVGYFLGIPLSIFIGYKLKNRFDQNITSIASIGVFLIGISFLFPGVNDIHRWVFAGNIPLNISMLIAPLMLYVISKSLNQRKFCALLLATSMELILVVQPDAGQTTAFGLGAVIIILFNRNLSYLIRLLVFIIISMSIVMVWYQPDTIPAVKQVELILRLAIKMGNLGVLGVIITVFLLILPIFLAVKQQPKKINYDDWVLAIAYIFYFLTQLMVTGFGNFPVPIIGAGAAPVLGWYSILGFLITKPYYDVNNYNS